VVLINSSYYYQLLQIWWRHGRRTEWTTQDLMFYLVITPLQWTVLIQNNHS